MALQLLWKNKCGEATFRRRIGTDTENFTYKDVTVNLYEGNAYLIFINEWKEDGAGKYVLWGFFSDKQHMKRCLGIDKKYKETYGDNIYDKEYDRLIKIRLNKAKSHNYKDIIAACAQAFKEIEIEVYTEEDSADGTD